VEHYIQGGNAKINEKPISPLGGISGSSLRAEVNYGVTSDISTDVLLEKSRPTINDISRRAFYRITDCILESHGMVASCRDTLPAHFVLQITAGTSGSNTFAALATKRP
jgi:hypothetical protein